MTDENTDITPAPVTIRRSWAGGLALLLSLITLIGLSYLWYVLRYQDRVLTINVPAHLAAEHQATTALGARLAAVATTSSQTADRLAALRAALSRRLGRRGATEDFRLREAQDLLTAANDRLRFEHSVPLAIAALREANRDISDREDPRLLPVRQAIISEIVRLRAMRRLHVDTMALTLLALAHAVDTLPLAVPASFRAAVRSSPPPRASGFWARVAAGFSRDFLGLIRIRHQVIHERALLAPRRQYFLRQNLKLQLYAAELALLEHRTALAEASLDAADRWVRRYFAIHTPPVMALHLNLVHLERRVRMLKWPDISRSLTLLRRLRRQS